MGKLDEQLIRAVVECKLAEATKLIDQGADVNTKDDSGWAPLHLAAEEGQIETVKYLVEKGADVAEAQTRKN